MVQNVCHGCAVVQRAWPARVAGAVQRGDSHGTSAVRSTSTVVVWVVAGRLRARASALGWRRDERSTVMVKALGRAAWRLVIGLVVAAVVAVVAWATLLQVEGTLVDRIGGL